MIVWLRLSFSGTNPRTHHGAWHAVLIDQKEFKCGRRINRRKSYQRFVGDRPPGTSCIVCLTKIAGSVEAEHEVQARLRRQS